jgi:hypothetical protein
MMEREEQQASRGSVLTSVKMCLSTQQGIDSSFTVRL